MRQAEALVRIFIGLYDAGKKAQAEALLPAIDRALAAEDTFPKCSLNDPLLCASATKAKEYAYIDIGAEYARKGEFARARQYVAQLPDIAMRIRLLGLVAEAACDRKEKETANKALDEMQTLAPPPPAKGEKPSSAEGSIRADLAMTAPG